MTWDQQHGFVKGKGFSTSTFHGAGWALDRTQFISKLYYLTATPWGGN